jgi:hypothetical protein
MTLKKMRSNIEDPEQIAPSWRYQMMFSMMMKTEQCHCLEVGDMKGSGKERLIIAPFLTPTIVS